MLGSDCALRFWTPAVTPTEPCTSPRSPPRPPPPTLSPGKHVGVLRCRAELSGDVQSVQFPFFQRCRSVETHKLHMFFPGRPLLFPRARQILCR